MNKTGRSIQLSSTVKFCQGTVECLTPVADEDVIVKAERQSMFRNNILAIRQLHWYTLAWASMSLTHFFFVPTGAWCPRPWTARSLWRRRLATLSRRKPQRGSMRCLRTWSWLWSSATQWPEPYLTTHRSSPRAPTSQPSKAWPSRTAAQVLKQQASS